jgi:hypothetical protein
MCITNKNILLNTFFMFRLVIWFKDTRVLISLNFLFFLYVFADFSFILYIYIFFIRLIILYKERKNPFTFFF